LAWRNAATATSLTPEARHGEWATPAVDRAPGRAEWLLPLFGLVLLGAFLAFMLDDYALRAVISTQ
jgi:hypothetical protein